MTTPSIPELAATRSGFWRLPVMQTKPWFFDVTLADGRIVRDVRVEAIDEDAAMDAIYACDALPAIGIASTHLQHTRNGKVRRS